MDAEAPPVSARRSAGGAAWLAAQLTNIAPFVTLLFLCVVFSG